jgi:hypothetical protein
MHDDAEIIEWILLAKGDLPGHDFHGNQYLTLEGAYHNFEVGSHDAVVQASKDTRDAIDNYAKGKSSSRTMALFHNGITKVLGRLGRGAAQSQTSADACKAATRAHIDAQLAHERVSALVENPKSTNSEIRKATADALDASRKAQALTETAAELTKVPLSILAKGDVDGHPFHGNQYTNGLYAQQLTESGLNPHETITRSTDISKLLDDIGESSASGGQGYIGVREWEGTRTRGVRLGDSMLKAFAIKNGWTVHDITIFADSKPGRHFGDLVTGQPADYVKAHGKTYLEGGAQELGLTIRHTQ